MAITIDRLADQLAMDPGDIRVMAEWLYAAEGTVEQAGGTVGDELPDHIGAAIHDVFDWHCVRAVPQAWWPGADPDAGKGATKMR